MSLTRPASVHGWWRPRLDVGGRLDTVVPNSRPPSDYPSETHRLNQSVDVRHVEGKTRSAEPRRVPSPESQASSTVKEEDSGVVIRVIIALDDPVIGYLRPVPSASEEQVIRWEGSPGGESVPGRGLGKCLPHEKSRGLVGSPRIEISPDHGPGNPRQATIQ